MIKFEEQYRAKGLYTLILQGDVYGLPDSVFIVPTNSLDYWIRKKFLTVWSKGTEMTFSRRKWQKYYTPRHQIEILLPMFYNDGTPIEPEKIDLTR